MIDNAAIQTFLNTMFPGLLGIELQELTPDRVVGTMMVRPDLCTAGETLHGGAFMAFADTLGAVATVINMPRGARTVTIESKTNFLNGAPVGGRVTAETTPFHKGRNTMVWQTKITREDGKLCAVVTQTQMVMALPT
jgi:1,4-dihydroxy-2-naphthoyl-CoA hydrolase